MVEHPSGHKIVVVCVQLEGPPSLVGEVERELLFLQDARPVSDSPTRKTWKSAVYIETRRAVKVAALEIKRAKEGPESRVLWSNEALTSTNSTHLIVLEWSQHPWYHSSRPDHVIVSEDGDSRHDLGDGSTHLATLVGLCHAEYSNLVDVDFGGQLQCLLDIGIDSDDDDLGWLGDQTGLDSPAELLPFAIDGRNDDSHIFGCIRRVFWDRDRFVCPVRDQVDHKPQVAKDARALLVN